MINKYFYYLLSVVTILFLPLVSIGQLCGGGDFTSVTATSTGGGAGTCEDPYECIVTYDICWDLTEFNEQALNWAHGVSISGLPAGATVAAGATGEQPTSDGNPNEWIFIDPGCTNTLLGIVSGPGFYVDYDTDPVIAGFQGDGDPCNNFGDEGNSGATVAVPEVFDGSTGTMIDLEPFCFTITINSCDVADCWRPQINLTGDGETGNHVIPDPACATTNFVPTMMGPNNDGTVCWADVCPTPVFTDNGPVEAGNDVILTGDGSMCGLDGQGGDNGMILDFYVYAPGGIPATAPAGYGTPVPPGAESQNPAGGFIGSGALDCTAVPNQLQCSFTDLEVVTFDIGCDGTVTFATDGLLTCPEDVTLTFFAYVYDYTKNCNGNTTTEYRSNCDVLRFDVDVTAPVAPLACESTVDFTGVYDAASGDINFAAGVNCDLDGSTGPNGHVVDLYVYAPGGVEGEAPAGFMVDLTNYTESANPGGGFSGVVDCALNPDQITCRNPELTIAEFNVDCSSMVAYTPLGNSCEDRIITFYAVVFDFTQNCDGDTDLEYASNCDPVRYDVLVPGNILPDFEFTTNTACHGDDLVLDAGADCSGIDGNGGTNRVVVDLYLYENAAGDPARAPVGFENTIDVSSPTESENASNGILTVSLNGTSPDCVVLPNQIECKNQNLASAAFNIDCTTGAVDIPAPDNEGCDEQIFTYFTIVFDYTLDTDGNNTLEYNPFCGMTIQRHDVVVYPADFTETVTPPDCDETVPKVLINSEDGTECTCITGTAGSANMNPAVDGELIWNLEYFSGSGCEQSFSGMLESACQPLPVELIAFEVRVENAYNLLTWETQSEENSAWFVVQRSVDGINFEEIGKTPAAGSSREAQQYEFTDEVPISRAYYRLMALDADGYFEYSDIIYLIRKNKGISDVKTYPMPFGQEFTLEFNTSRQTAMMLQIHDVTGRLVKTIEVEQTIDGLNQLSIDLGHHQDGVYFLTLYNDKETINRRLVKRSDY